jgi:hypothetical protein
LWKSFSQLAWPEAFLTTFSQPISGIISSCFFRQLPITAIHQNHLNSAEILSYACDQLSNNKAMCEGNECTWEGWGIILVRSHHERIDDVVYLPSFVRIQPDLLKRFSYLHYRPLPSPCVGQPAEIYASVTWVVWGTVLPFFTKEEKKLEGVWKGRRGIEATEKRHWVTGCM